MATQSTTTANTTAAARTAAAAAAAEKTLTDGIGSVATSFEENLGRVQSLNETFLDAAKLSGNLTLDTYDKALTSVLDYNRSMASAAKFDWVTALVDAQASLVQGLSAAATTAAREALR